MAAKTGKNEAGEAEAVADAQQEPAAEEKPARPAKRKRRVRVIEIIDDEDLDEVLDALDAEDEEPPPPAPEPVHPPKDERPEPKRAESERPEPAEPEPATHSTTFGLGTVPTVVIVVVVALLASLAIWQWRSASGLSAEQDDRDAVERVAAAYGDVAFNYNAANYRSQTAKAERLMAGDLLESFRSDTVSSLVSAFKADPQVGLTSTTNQVFVGSVNGRFATAVVMVDVGYKTKDGSVSSPATLLRLALAKIDGSWKITRQYPSGVNDQNRDQGQLPAVPSGTPKAGKSGEPKN
ncbi:hypothetical protein [Actinomadura macra]|uniref:hypothetical protein n=1 Tax=Actinomadura macra TaxID=46164 RepID=UPI0008325E4E|nr:hypothetical protein [Actinomadura macra]